MKEKREEKILPTLKKKKKERKEGGENDKVVKMNEE